MRWSHAVSLGLVSMTASFLTGCSTVEGVGATRANAHPLSFQLKDEKVELKYVVPKPDPDRPGLDAIGVTAATIGIGIALDAAREGLEKEAARYSQEYSSSAVFQWVDGGKLELTRTVDPVGTAEHHSGEAATAVIRFERLEGPPAYKIVLESLEIDLARAKIPKPALPKVNVELAIAVRGIWTKEGRLYRENLTIGGSTKISDLTLGEPAKLTNRDGSTGRTMGFVYLPSGSVADPNSLLLEASIAVKESDRTRANKAFVLGAAILEDNKSSLASGIIGEILADE